MPRNVADEACSKDGGTTVNKLRCRIVIPFKLKACDPIGEFLPTRLALSWMKSNERLGVLEVSRSVSDEAMVYGWAKRRLNLAAYFQFSPQRGLTSSDSFPNLRR